MAIKIAAFGKARKSVSVTYGHGRADGFACIGRIRKGEHGGYVFQPNSFGREHLSLTELVGRTINEIRAALKY